jgi:ribosomal protein S27AE
MSYQVAKNASRWAHAPAIQGRFVRRVIEEEESLPDWPYTRKISREVVAYEKVLVCPDCGAMLLDAHGNPLRAPKKMGERKRKCGQCGAPLWQRIPFKYGGRVAAADFLNRRYAGQYDLILDESHKTKGGKTDAGYASQDLIAGARKVLSMTGTLYAGKVSSIFHLLYRLKPEFRRLYGPGEVQRFVNHHGLQEIVTTITTTGNAYSSAFGYTRESVRVREVPGVTPGIILMLLPMTAFIKLQDVGLHLPPYREERLPVRLDGRFDEGLKKIKEIYERAVQLAREGNPGLLSAWLYAGLGWPDHPVPDTLVARDSTTGDVIDTFDIPGLADEPPGLPLPKDQALLELVEAELGKGRGVGVFFAQVKRRDWMGRIQKLLAGRGVYSEILRRGTCRPNRRERWYRAFVERCRERGQEPVLLTNGNLIKEGLDLVELPTLVETGIEFRLNDLRQRDRRSWRLIQDRPVRVVFLYYEASWQETALRLVAAKLKAATLVEGDLVSGLAEMDTDGDNLMDALMEAITRGRRSGWNGMGLARLAESGEPGRLPTNTNGGKPSGGRGFEAVFRIEEEKTK